MISLQEFTREPTLAELADRLTSRVMDCADFYRWKDLHDGSREAWFILRKPLPGIPAGTAMRLRDLHDVLCTISP